MLARFDDIPAMTLLDIKETKHYRRTEARRQHENSIPPKQFAGGIMNYTGNPIHGALSTVNKQFVVSLLLVLIYKATTLKNHY